MNNPQQIELVAECLKPVHKFGETVYLNVCTGGSVVVPGAELIGRSAYSRWGRPCCLLRAFH